MRLLAATLPENDPRLAPVRPCSASGEPPPKVQSGSKSCIIARAPHLDVRTSAPSEGILRGVPLLHLLEADAHGLQRAGEGGSRLFAMSSAFQPVARLTQTVSGAPRGAD